MGATGSFHLPSSRQESVHGIRSAQADRSPVSTSLFPQPHSIPLFSLFFPMFRAARFNTIRRTLHTQARPTSRSLLANKLAFAGAASAVTLTYFAWRMSSPSKQLAMDTNREIRKHSPNNRIPPVSL